MHVVQTCNSVGIYLFRFYIEEAFAHDQRPVKPWLYGDEFSNYYYYYRWSLITGYLLLLTWGCIRSCAVVARSQVVLQFFNSIINTVARPVMILFIHLFTKIKGVAWYLDLLKAGSMYITVFSFLMFMSMLAWPLTFMHGTHSPAGQRAHV